MTESNNKVLVFFVVLVVILSAVFTWEAMSLNDKSNSAGSGNSAPQKQVEFTTSAEVGIDIQPVENKGGA